MKIRESFAGNNVEIIGVGGPLPYLWIGVNETAVCAIGSIRQLRAIKRMCEKAIASHPSGEKQRAANQRSQPRNGRG